MLWHQKVSKGSKQALGPAAITPPTQPAILGQRGKDTKADAALNPKIRIEPTFHDSPLPSRFIARRE
eukprot:1210714-Pleurochrysis_carterae.AAC.2